MYVCFVAQDVSFLPIWKLEILVKCRTPRTALLTKVSCVYNRQDRHRTAQLFIVNSMYTGKSMITFNKFHSLFFIGSMLIILLSSCSQNTISKAEFSEKLKKTAFSINNDFSLIRKEVGRLARFTEKLYEKNSQDKVLSEVDRSKYKISVNGVFYKPLNDGNSAVFVSGHIPVDNTIKEVVFFTEPLDRELKEIVSSYPEIVQAYYNDRFSYNRIFPYFDVLTQYEPKMNIPEFNFYYLADQKHNPEKKAVWVKEPYVDPAGRGWMVSAIAPVYVADKLEGVSGLDVTISTITERYIKALNNQFIILDKNGVIVSINESLTGLLSLPRLEDHTYLETIKQDTYRTDNFNLLNSKSRSVREAVSAIYHEGKNEIVFIKDKEHVTILSEKIPELDWYILLVFKS